MHAHPLRHSPHCDVGFFFSFTVFPLLFLLLSFPSILSWQVKLPPVVGQPRWSFSLGFHNRSPTEVELVVFGGYQYDLMTNEDTIRSGTTLLYLGMCKCVHFSGLTPDILVCGCVWVCGCVGVGVGVWVGV